MNALAVTHAGAWKSGLFGFFARIGSNRPAVVPPALCLFFFCLMFSPHLARAAEGAVVVLNPAGIRADGMGVDSMLGQIVRVTSMSTPTPPLPGASSAEGASTETDEYRGLKSARVRIPVQHDPLAEINGVFHRQRWTDGLPIIPPTPERVAAMLRGTDLPPDFSVARLEPMRGEATVEKIAINAVMAGCRPEYLPILIAAVEAIGEEAMDLIGSSTTTSPDAPIIIAGGPMIRQLGINDGRNTFGRGNRANSSIGRAFHLILHNVGGSKPGISDMSSIGQPGEFVGFLAESPHTDTWEPLHATLGLPADVNAVTVATAEGFHGIRSGLMEPKEFLGVVADSIRSDSWPHRGAAIVVIADDTAKMMESEGWTRKRMEEYLRENIKVTAAEFRRAFGDLSTFLSPHDASEGVPRWLAEKGKDDNVMVPRPFIDQLLFVRAGGKDADLKNLFIPCWHTGKAISKEVHFPQNLPELLKATEDAGL